MPRGLKCKNSKMPAKIIKNFFVNFCHLFWALNGKGLQWNFQKTISITKRIIRYLCESWIFHRDI